jgi:hypothetical protein
MHTFVSTDEAKTYEYRWTVTDSNKDGQHAEIGEGGEDL